MAFSVSLCPSIPYKDNLILDWEPTCIIQDELLLSGALTTSWLHKRVFSLLSLKILGIRTWTYLFSGHRSAHHTQIYRKIDKSCVYISAIAANWTHPGKEDTDEVIESCDIPESPAPPVSHCSPLGGTLYPTPKQPGFELHIHGVMCVFCVHFSHSPSYVKSILVWL